MKLLYHAHNIIVNCGLNAVKEEKERKGDKDGRKF